jgi:glycerol kinase
MRRNRSFPMPFVLALDQGTTSSRAIVFDAHGTARASAQQEFRQIFPRAGWVEHDATEIWATQSGVMHEALAKAGVAAGDIAAIGITNQRETTVLWERASGRPIANAIVWQDRRTGIDVRRASRRGPRADLPAQDRPRARRVLLGHQAQVAARPRARRARAREARRARVRHDRQLARVEPDAGARARDRPVEREPARSCSTSTAASGTTSSARCSTCRARCCRRSCRRRACAARPRSAASSIPIAGIAGDQQAALFGQACHAPGLAKNTYGTGCFLLMNTGTKAVASSNQLLTTIAWRRDGRTDYALEGSVFIGGAVVQWLRDGLKIIRSANEVNALAASVPDNGGVYLVPAFAGSARRTGMRTRAARCSGSRAA